MEFYETVMGKQFYSSTMPRMAKAIEATNDRLEKLAEIIEGSQVVSSKKTAEGMQNLYDFPVTEDIVEQALAFAINDDEATFFGLIVKEIESDDNAKPSKLVADYHQATPAERRVIDAVFVDLTGWSLSTLLTKYVESCKGKDEEDNEEAPFE